MKKKYYVNKKAQANGDHEVHVEGCSYMPASENKQYLGEFDNCKEAVAAAKDFPQANGCYYCCKPCHNS